MGKRLAGGILGVAVVAALVPWLLRGHRAPAQREALFRELRSAAILGCEPARYGAHDDGGYLLCGGLLDGTAVAYSYGIDGRDTWGCDVSRRHGLTVHQYDCFNTAEPECPGGAFVFHPECVGGRAKTEDGRIFDTVATQVGRNGDAGRRLIVKMDVEGAEWRTLATAPDALLDRIDQLVVEFHGVIGERRLRVVKRLKERFHVANVHFNNHACADGIEPFSAWAYEVLLVNKRIAERNPDAPAPARPHPLDRPNIPSRPDCQNLP